MTRPAQTDAQNVVRLPRRNYQVDVVPRAEFLHEFGNDYAPGQHVSFIGPTQRGKTYLSHQMLGTVISPDHKCVILSGKPPRRDRTMAQAAKRLNLRVVEQWPPDWALGDRKRNGYVLRPHQSMTDLDADEKNMREQFRKGLIGNYSSDRPVITVADEANHIQNKLRLKSEYEAPLMRGAPDNAMWSLMQRGAYNSLFAYDSAEHIIFFYEPDERNVRRYAEMVGGVDPRYVAAVVTNLKTYRTKGGQTISEALYVKRSGSEMYVIDVT